MKILVGCEFSRIVAEAFEKKGHDVTSCDLLPAERKGEHYQGDIMDIIYHGWDMMIAFPPCTHLSVSGARFWQVKRVEQRRAILFFMLLVNAPIGKIAIENPVGIMSTVYRKPDQIIHPYYFGDNVPKKTCLWLKGLHPLIHRSNDDLFGRKTHVDPYYIMYKSKKTKSGFSRYSVYGRLGKGQGKERSYTSQGIAEAMARQWGG